jgi:two-component system, chemotaxis family, sensor kinase CheA
MTQPDKESMQMDFDRDAVLAAFLAESEEGLAAMEQSLIALETGSAEPEVLHDIFRVAHTIKGNAAALELTPLVNFAHEVEDLLEGLRSQEIAISEDVISLLLATVDELRVLVPSAIAGATSLTPRQNRLRSDIEALARGSRSGVAPASNQAVVPQSSSSTNVVQSVARRTLRADISRLDDILNLTGEIAIAHGQLRQMIEKLKGEQAVDILEVHRDTERLYLDLQEQVMRIRMVTVGPVFRQLGRTVRDVAKSHGKEARLEIVGDDVEIDTTIVEHLKDALLHMVRNAVDHGIETPEARVAAGKPACGVINLSASHSAGNILIEIRDDGSGLDRRRIAEKARALGLISESERLNDEELFGLIFEAGFSTAESVTDLSGRGVGMDVVRRKIEALRGNVHVSSKEGTGTVINIRLPLTLAILEGFSVACADETFVIPLEYVKECIELPEQSDGASDIVNLRGQAIPYVRLRDLFGFPPSSTGRQNIVIVSSGGVQAGVAVDGLLGATQAVIKPLAKIFRDIPEISGSTILGDGRVGLILDVPGLIRQAQTN